MIDLLILWIGLLVALLAFAVGPPGRGGALTLAYFLDLSLIHVPGVVVFLDDASGLSEFADTSYGFELTLAGMAAFVAGAVAARLTGQTIAQSRPPTIRAGGGIRRLGLAGVGTRCRLLPAAVLRVRPIGFGDLDPFLVPEPAHPRVLDAVSYRTGSPADGGRGLLALGLLPLLPLMTLVTGGFLGYGVHWVLGTLAFWYIEARRRLWIFLASPLLVFIGLSLFVTYMSQREAIRDVVWYEQAGFFERLERVSRVITDFQLLDLSSDAHLAAIDERLNQNELVGAAMARHWAGFYDFAYGGTVPLWGFVPRALWPDKPAVGGGGSLVTEYTGIPFGEGTSVGAGQVLEFYVNFGIPGVLAGFTGLGFLLMRLDLGIMRAFSAGDLPGLLLRALPGLSLLQPGGNLLEILVALVGAVLGVGALHYSGVFGVPRCPPSACRTAAFCTLRDSRTMSTDDARHRPPASPRACGCGARPRAMADPPTACRGSAKPSPPPGRSPCCSRSPPGEIPPATRRIEAIPTGVSRRTWRVFPVARVAPLGGIFPALERGRCRRRCGSRPWTRGCRRTCRRGGPPLPPASRSSYSPRGMLSPPALSFSRAKKRVFWKLLQGPVIRRAACIHATSGQEYDELRAFGLRHPIAVIPNGIDMPDPVPDRAGVRRERVVLSLGRMHPKRGSRCCCKPGPRLSRGCPGWRLSLVGPGEERYVRELQRSAHPRARPRLVRRTGLWRREMGCLPRRRSLRVAESEREFRPDHRGGPRCRHTGDRDDRHAVEPG